MTKSSYLPSTLSQHKYVEASGYTCCYQTVNMCIHKFVFPCTFVFSYTKISKDLSTIYYKKKQRKN